jgi:iron complex transport system substrate-binding protein
MSCRALRLGQEGMSASRRAAVAGLVASLALAGRPATAASLRVATVDWSLLETLLAIGVLPVAAAELVLYRKVAVEPPVPESVADIGLRGQPNYEALRSLQPELILTSNYYAWAEPKLQLVAPVERVSIYGTGEPVYAAAERAARILGDRLGQAAEAGNLIDSSYRELADLKNRLSGWNGRPVLPINLGDARHFRVFGADSMFGDILTRLGLANAWTMPTSYSATAPIGIETLAQLPDAWIAIIPPVPVDARRILPDSVFWNALPNVQAGRIRVLEPVDPFGGLPAGLRFARLLSDALTVPSTGAAFG